MSPVLTYYSANSIAEAIHYLWLKIFGLRSIEENSRALINDDNCKIVDRADFIDSCRPQSRANTLLDGRDIWLISTEPLRKTSDDGIFIHISEVTILAQ
jgi:hypothetical protein